MGAQEFTGSTPCAGCSHFALVCSQSCSQSVCRIALCFQRCSQCSRCSTSFANSFPAPYATVHLYRRANYRGPLGTLMTPKHLDREQTGNSWERITWSPDTATPAFPQCDPGSVPIPSTG